jgi:hypothetical protein
MSCEATTAAGVADEYAPFPEQELRALSAWHARAASAWNAGSPTRLAHEQRAQVCNDALASHAAMRERMLIAEMQLAQLKQGAAA